MATQTEHNYSGKPCIFYIVDVGNEAAKKSPYWYRRRYYWYRRRGWGKGEAIINSCLTDTPSNIHQKNSHKHGAVHFQEMLQLFQEGAFCLVLHLKLLLSFNLAQFTWRAKKLKGFHTEFLSKKQAFLQT